MPYLKTSIQGSCESMAVDGNYLYACISHSGGGSVIKINLDTFEEEDVLILVADEEWLDACVIDGDYLYIAVSKALTGSVVKVDLTSFTRIGAVNLAGATPYAIAVYGDFLYLGFLAAFGALQRVRISTFATAGILVLPAGDGDYILPHSLLAYDDILYAGMNADPAVIVRIDIPTFTRTDNLTLNAGEENARRLARNDTDLYVATEYNISTYTPYVVKVDLTLFTRTAAVAVDAVSIMGMVVTDDTLYVSADQLHKINLTDFQVIKTSQFSGLLPESNDGIAAHSNYVYVAFYSNFDEYGTSVDLWYGIWKNIFAGQTSMVTLTGAGI